MTWDKMSEKEKNILIGEQIFGWVPDPEEDIWWEGEKSRHPDNHPFVSQISCAWEVVEKMKRDYYFLSMCNGDDGYAVSFITTDDQENEIRFSEEAETVTEAISKAALKAKGVEI